jgi:hypothetical protein
MKKEEAELIASAGAGNNPFENHVGDFWSITETRDYMEARHELADNIYGLAIKANPRSLCYWEVMIGHYQDLLRLCCDDNLGLRQDFPFLLLHANRDDDAASFIVYWLKKHIHGGSDSTAQRHVGSSVGEWIYPREKDARFFDVMELCSHEDDKHHDLAMLVAAA